MVWLACSMRNHTTVSIVSCEYLLQAEEMASADDEIFNYLERAAAKSYQVNHLSGQYAHISSLLSTNLQLTFLLDNAYQYQ